MSSYELAPEIHIKYDYKKNRDNPAQVFEAMALYINAYRDLAQLLATAVGIDVNLELKLNDIEKSSLLSKISAARNTIGNAIEETLYKSSERLFEELIPETETKTTEQVDNLAKALEDALARNFLDQLIPPHIDREKLAFVLESFSTANQKVKEEESVTFLQAYVEGSGCKLNTSWRFTGDPKSMFMGHTEPQRHADRLIITVAVYVGNSLWSFQSLSSEKKFSAKITDEVWLKKYQSGLVQPIGPKDVIEAELEYDLYTPPLGQGPAQMRNARIIQVKNIYRNNAYQYDYGF